jgi:hypothetical protein
MRIGRYSVYYYGQLVKKVWDLNKAYELIANMVQCGYKKDGFEITCLSLGFDL